MKGIANEGRMLQGIERVAEERRQANLQLAAAYYRNHVDSSLKEVAQRFGLPWQPMRRAFLKMGIELRKSGIDTGAVPRGMRLTCPHCKKQFKVKDGLP